MPVVPDRYRVPIALALLGLAIAGLLVLVFRLPQPRDEIRIVRPTPSPVPAELLVHVAGAVATPGVYRLAPGQRVEDAIQAAGGPAAEADLDRLNLAAPVGDGQQVVVPRRPGPAGAAGAGEPAAATGRARLDLNTASAAELDTLPGIGPATSAKIVEHRQRQGPFRRVEELRDLKLVPPSTYERIKDLVTVR